MSTPTPTEYWKPSEPSDPNAEYMTVQETAWVIKVGVTTLRKITKADTDGVLHSRHGRRIVTTREDRARINELLRPGTAASRRRIRRRQP